MAWSTRQLAELAGTTVKAVRYYHKIGLLDMPRRMSNGYKQYEIEHLIRLLKIKRFSDLGIPLSEVPTMDSAAEGSDEPIRALDAELEATIARLSRAREELAEILRHGAPGYIPSSFAPVSEDLSDRQRSLLVVYSSVLSEAATKAFRELIDEPQDSDKEFEALAPDADEAAIERLAARLLPVVRQGRQQHPWSKTPGADAPYGSERAEQAMAEAVVQLYNPAQLRVLKRLHEFLTEEDTAVSHEEPQG